AIDHLHKEVEVVQIQHGASTLHRSTIRTLSSVFADFWAVSPLITLCSSQQAIAVRTLRFGPSWQVCPR
ncbi:MAG TPA: hypothetical protein VGM98_03745, partial [Schlesneria sp.]